MLLLLCFFQLLKVSFWSLLSFCSHSPFDLINLSNRTADARSDVLREECTPTALTKEEKGDRVAVNEARVEANWGQCTFSTAGCQACRGRQGPLSEQMVTVLKQQTTNCYRQLSFVGLYFCKYLFGKFCSFNYLKNSRFKKCLSIFTLKFYFRFYLTKRNKHSLRKNKKPSTSRGVRVERVSARLVRRQRTRARLATLLVSTAANQTTAAPNFSVCRSI